MKQKKRHTQGTNDASGIICACFHCRCPQPLLLSFVVVHIGFLLIERKKEEKKRHKHSGEDRPAIMSVIGTTGWIQFDQINDVVKVY
jgi:hypothetical protein